MLLRRRVPSRFLASGAMILYCCGSIAQQDAPPTREGRWRQDLDVFAREFGSSQKDFGTLYPKKRFDGGLTAIGRNLAQLSDAEIILRLMRLVASAHVGHTNVRFPRRGPMVFHRLPLGLHWYSDGLGVTAAAPQYNQALGARVLKIGSMNPHQLESAVAPYISYENAFGLLEESTIYMLTEEVLQELHLTAPDGRVEFTLAKSGGEPFTLFVAPVDGAAKTALVSAADGLHVPPPLYRKHPDSYYWYEYLPDAQTLYIQYNRCQNDPHLPFEDFARDLFAFADGHAVQRVVIDLRFNGGGNSTVINPLLEGLKSRTALSARGHLHGLMGRATFSSGFLAAINLRDDLAAILVGEPSGEKPNSYGEVKTLTLPNTQLEVQYSTKFFKIVKHKDPQALAPDIVMRSLLEDALAGRDPVLDAALHHPLR